MIQFVLDTDTLSLFQRGHPILVSRVLAVPSTTLAVTVITVEEQLAGWFTLVRRAKEPPALARAYLRLGEAVGLLGQFPILPYTEGAIHRFDELRAAKLGVAANDLRIASIVLEHDTILVTRNASDFRRIPGLRIESWA
jgi:tRNA(fMet)-specific endonuclease VapC